jgi:hypothetical protein
VFVPALTILNSALEWLLIPLALLSNWRLPRRRVLLLTAAARYYVTRVWSYVYIIPRHCPGRIPRTVNRSTPACCTLRTSGSNLSFARGAGDLLLFALVLTALGASGRPKQTPRSSPIRIPDVYTGNATLRADR